MLVFPPSFWYKNRTNLWFTARKDSWFGTVKRLADIGKRSKTFQSQSRFVIFWSLTRPLRCTYSKLQLNGVSLLAVRDFFISHDCHQIEVNLISLEPRTWGENDTWHSSEDSRSCLSFQGTLEKNVAHSLMRFWMISRAASNHSPSIAPWSKGPSCKPSNSYKRPLMGM